MNKEIIIEYNAAKDEWLREKRGIGFKEIVYYMQHGYLLDVIEHPNQARHKNQRVCVVNVDGYVYLVPFGRVDDKIILKTIFPCRKMTRNYKNSLNGGINHEEAE